MLRRARRAGPDATFGEEKANRGKCAKLHRTCFSRRIVFGWQGKLSAEVLRVGELYEG